MTTYPDTRIVTASMLTLSSVIVIAGFTYNISKLETLAHGSIAVTLDTGYCQVVGASDTIRVYISDEELDAWADEVIDREADEAETAFEEEIQRQSERALTGE